MLFKSRILYLKKRILDRSFRSTTMNDFHYVRLDKKEVLRNVARSRLSLETQHSQQTGLSIRCIEMLGAKRKLITNNSDIKTYDFYDANNNDQYDFGDTFEDRNCNNLWDDAEAIDKGNGVWDDAEKYTDCNNNDKYDWNLYLQEFIINIKMKTLQITR